MNYKINVDHENDPDNYLEITGGDRKKIKEPVTISITVVIEENKYETITDLKKQILKIFE